jgi:uncharacterized delta-60 repeat protein
MRLSFPSLAPLFAASVLVVFACSSGSDQGGAPGGPDGGGPPPPPGGGDDAGDAGGDGGATGVTFAPDPSFGKSGVVALDLGSSEESLATLAAQADGSVVLVGCNIRVPSILTAGDLTDLFVARFTAAGQPDATFGLGGKALLPTVFHADPRAATVQPDGKIVVVGRTNRLDDGSDYFLVARIDKTGALDSTFGAGGLVVDTPGTAHAVTVQGDGKVLVAGDSAGMAVVRYAADGSRDAAFGSGGIARFTMLSETHGLSVGIQPGGAIALGGAARDYATGDHAGFLVRVTSAGARDTTFNTTGEKLIQLPGNEPYDVGSTGVGPSGTIVVAGSRGGTSFLDRFTSSGAADATWGAAGSAAIPNGGMFDPIDVDGAGVVSYAQGSAVLRFGTTGAPDATFGAAGVSGATAMPGNLRAFGRSANGTYFLGSQPAAGIAAVHVGATGTPDAAYGTAGVATATSGASREEMIGVAAQTDGKILTAGVHAQTTLFFARFDGAGAPDASFATTGRFEEKAFQIDKLRGPVLAPGGGFYFASNVPGGSQVHLVKYDGAGAHDASFGTGGVATYYSPLSAEPTGLAVDASGRPVLSLYDVNVPGILLVRYTTAGVLDSSFGTGGTVQTTTNGSPTVQALAIQPDGKILVAAPGFGNMVVARYSAGGVLDTTFGTMGIATLMLGGLGPTRIVPLADGSALVAGWYGQQAMDMPGIFLARIGPTGSLDATFGTGGVVKTPTGLLVDRLDLAVGTDTILVGTTGSDDGVHAQLRMIRYTKSGSLDLTFGTGGEQRLSLSKGNDVLNAMALDAAGLPLVAGRTWSPSTGTDALLARLK